MIRFWILISFLALMGCKEEPVDLSNMSKEDIYFHDYEDVRHKWGYIDTTGEVVNKARVR